MRKLLCSSAIVVIASVAGVTCYNHESDNELSDLAKKNVKALAKDGIVEIEALCMNDIVDKCFKFTDDNGEKWVILGTRVDNL